MLTGAVYSCSCDQVHEDNQKTDGGTVFKQILINAKLKTRNRGQKTELTGKSPLRRQRTALDYSAI